MCKVSTLKFLGLAPKNPTIREEISSTTDLYGSSIYYCLFLFVMEVDLNMEILITLQWIYGFLVFFFPGGSTTIRSESLPWHVIVGVFAYILAVANAAIGFLEKLTFLENSGLAKYGSEALLVNFTAAVAIFYGAFVILTVVSQGPPVEDDYSYTAI